MTDTLQKDGKEEIYSMERSQEAVLVQASVSASVCMSFISLSIVRRPSSLDPLI